MDAKEIERLEGAGDVDGLVHVLKDVRTHVEGGTASGVEARAALEQLGLNVSAYASVKVVDLGNARVVDDSSVVRADAARALGRLNEPAGNLALLEALRDGTPRVRIAAREALVASFGEPMRRALDRFDEKSGFSQFAAIEKAGALVEQRK